MACDVYLKFTSETGRVVVSSHRAWDKPRFLAAKHHRATHADDAEDRGTVEEISEREYQALRKGC